MTTGNKSPTTASVRKRCGEANSAQAQRLRILASLHHKSLTTFEARQQLDIPHPAGRVQELRRAGYAIQTHWSDVMSNAGRRHRIARYVLFATVAPAARASAR